KAQFELEQTSTSHPRLQVWLPTTHATVRLLPHPRDDAFCKRPAPHSPCPIFSRHRLERKTSRRTIACGGAPLAPATAGGLAGLPPASRVWVGPRWGMATTLPSATSTPGG